MLKQARISLTVTIPKPLERDLRKAAERRGRSFDSVIESCLEDGLEQLSWDSFADALIKDVRKAQAKPCLTSRQKDAIGKKGLRQFAEAVAICTKRQNETAVRT